MPQDVFWAGDERGIPHRMVREGDGFREVKAIVVAPAAILSEPSATVRDFQAHYVEDLVSEMLSVMHDTHAIGLAAPQIGVAIRVAVIETKPGCPLVLVNPEITAQYGELMGEEGCLSLPNVRLPIKRAARVAVTTAHWTRDFSGLTAVAIQHEIDHLNGILITDRHREQAA